MDEEELPDLLEFMDLQQKSRLPRFINRDLRNVVTPINHNVLRQHLVESRYNADKTNYLVRGFKEGFSLCYEGPINRRDQSKNLPIRVGSKEDIWQKVMKEVECK